MGLDGVLVASVGVEGTGHTIQADPEEEAWQLAKAANTAAAYDAYLADYPRGKFASAARIARTRGFVKPIERKGMNLAQYCVDQFGVGTEVSNARSDAYPWRCVARGQQVKIDMSSVCKSQHGATHRALVDDPNDSYTWHCISD